MMGRWLAPGGSALTRLDACNGVGRILSVVDTIRGAYFQTKNLLRAMKAGDLAAFFAAHYLRGNAFATGSPN